MISSDMPMVSPILTIQETPISTPSRERLQPLQHFRQGILHADPLSRRVRNHDPSDSKRIRHPLEVRELLHRHKNGYWLTQSVHGDGAISLTISRNSPRCRFKSVELPCRMVVLRCIRQDEPCNEWAQAFSIRTAPHSTHPWPPAQSSFTARAADRICPAIPGLP